MAADARWYVVHTYSGYEKKVATNIENVIKNHRLGDEILEVKIPVEIVTVAKDDKKSGSKANIYDDYSDDVEKSDDEEAAAKEKETGKKAKTKEIERKLFPGYVFVKVAVSFDDDDRPKMSDRAWLVIRNTRGVTGFVGPDSKAMALSEEEVIKFGVEERSGEDGLFGFGADKRIEVKYKVGDTVNIVDGPFADFMGVVSEIDLENNVVKVIVSALFGRETPVELGLDQVKAVEE